ncbi:ABC transporter ATP-binding protein [Parendozoicomonas haliclonae]|uniref:Putative ABC transporter ATP-binding protein n=1 Tax=Parendozoicomonas haliclonae TaxID=1960125 RepID=A0A1X7ASZ8_9GAMM|nr:ABC transporter ATP-binding protein [Parendozoicomonas haliclonae]SMA50527.1 putative ABC transporter ATP-binding protein [Parendozoicomonas haliclonae]
MESSVSSVSDSSGGKANTYSWTRIRKIIFSFKKELAIANVVAIMATLASVPTPLLLSLLVDEVLLEKPAHVVEFLSSLAPTSWHSPEFYIGAVLLLSITLRLLALIFNVWQTRQFTLISKEVAYRIRRSLLNKLGRVSMSEYETLGSGSVSSRFVTDLNTIDQFIGSTVSRLLVAFLTLFGTALVLLWIHWQLALLILVLNPIVIYFTAKLGKRVKELKKNENQAFDIFQQALTETLEGIQEIRAANREKHYLLRLRDKARNVRNASSEFSWRNDAASRLSFMLFVVGVDAFRAAAMVAVVYSDLTIGQLVAVGGYLWFMLTPVNELLNMQYGLYAANAAMKRINDLLTLGEEPRYAEKNDPHHIDPFSDNGQLKSTVGLALDNVWFSYGDQPVLRGVSLHVQPGEKVALVGASGGGKSTLVKAVLGLHQASSGRILFDDVPLEQIGVDCVREHVAIVLQHPALFDTSVRENLTLGREADDETLWQALEVAQLKEFIAELPEGLDTRVGNRGVRLSGGQRQRVAIARMIVSDPRVVILDEATSALDAETEHQLHRAMETFLENRTTLIIAHRLSAVKEADRVYVFEDGHITEHGDHDQLMGQNGVYARLYGTLQERQKNRHPA